MEQPNLSYIEEMSAGNKIFQQKIINIIKNEFPQEKSEYFLNFKNKDFKLTADNVHKLKHKISILGLEKSYQIAIDYENNLIEGKTILSDEFEIILNTISDYLKSI